MKLADLAPDVLADLSHSRWFPGGRYEHPAAGAVWFGPGRVCAFCGYIGRLVTDHCHTTGLVRGLLCHSCNSDEARRDSPAWDLWRVAAPALASREFYSDQFGHVVSEGHLTEDEVLTLPMAELLATARLRRRRRVI